MSDLFHKDVPNEFILKVFETMVKAKHHTFQVLTKRSERMMNWCESNFSRFTIAELSNIWLGVSVEDNEQIFRIEHLENIPTIIRFLSLEPLLESLNWSFELSIIDWVIVGGESGPGARRMNVEWVREIRDNCVEQGIPFFFKQWGEYNQHGEKVGRKAAGRILDRKVWSEFPIRRIKGGQGTNDKV